MSLIRKDEEGLFVIAGGWISRPTGTSRFKAGDKTEAKHFGGSPIVGIGKLKGRGKYSEYWRTAGLSPEMVNAGGQQ